MPRCFYPSRLSSTPALQSLPGCRCTCLSSRLELVLLFPADAAVEAPRDLMRGVDLDAEVLRKLPHEAGILLEGAPDQSDIRALLDQLFCERASGDGTHRTDQQRFADLLL